MMTRRGGLRLLLGVYRSGILGIRFVLHFFEHYEPTQTELLRTFACSVLQLSNNGFVLFDVEPVGLGVFTEQIMWCERL
jgi:hypothetical protein